MKLLRNTVAALLPVLLLASCGASDTTSPTEGENSSDAQPSPPPNTDPAKGWVVISNYDDPGNVAVLEKICDGTTLVRVSLIYGNRGDTVYEPDSPQCGAR